MAADVVAEAVRLIRSAQAVTVTGTVKGRIVDKLPKCQHCGSRVGNYLGLPWSLRCQSCGKQASGE